MENIKYYKNEMFVAKNLNNWYVGEGDITYRDFIKKNGDGFYFSNSFHLYGGDNTSNHDFHIISKFINHLYENILPEFIMCFGCDIFGNQFVFYSKGVGFMNVETGKIEFIGETFADFLRVFYSDVNYYSGQSILIEWEKINGYQISFENRLVPKTLIVLGGSYSVENFYDMNFETSLRFYSDVANQIYNLPDGTKIKIKTI